jgi:PhzF family phenazine biosynthesis protein
MTTLLTGTTVPFFQVNAFTRDRFKGNTAGVCLLPDRLGNAAAFDNTVASDDIAVFDDTATLQSIATENNHPATAFVRRTDDGFALRWFSASKELPLCGHGTLAAAQVLAEQGWLTTGKPAHFQTLAGPLTVRLLPGEGREGDWMEMEFPAFPLVPAVLPESLIRSFAVAPRQVLFAHDRFLVELESEAAVRAYQPDFELLKDHRMIITAVSETGVSNDESRAPNEPGVSYDFVSRFFAVPYGVYEDAVTGSAHCALTPFWADRLGKTTLRAYQASARGGMLRLRLEKVQPDQSPSLGDKVFIAGQAITVLRGDLVIRNNAANFYYL